MVVEWVFLSMHLNSVSYIICGVYFPPISAVSVYELFTLELENIVSNNSGSVFIVCGDFNLPDILWSNYETELIYSRCAYFLYS